MMPAHTHIVGAGIAGLSAALSISRKGGRATLYDAAPQAGGRCRTISSSGSFAHDNGTHVIFSGNRSSIHLIEEIGARAQWIEPEPDGLDIYDAGSSYPRRIGLTPLSWRNAKRRPSGLHRGDLWRLAKLCLGAPDRPVGDLFRGSAILDAYIEPLTIAVLNTPVSVASSRRLGRALRRLALPGAAHLFIARRGLSPDLIEPALRTLASRSVALQSSRRLKSLALSDGRVTQLLTPDGPIPVRADERVILALPPYEVARLLPGLPVPTAFEPILNIHFRLSGLAEQRMIGFTRGLAQWAVIRRDHVSVTVSAAQDHIDLNADELARRIWSEIRPALRDCGLPLPENTMPECRVVKEKRATISQTVAPLPQPPVRPFVNLALAGDWIGTLPATIESAVIAGHEATRALDDPTWRWRRTAPLPELTLEGAR